MKTYHWIGTDKITYLLRRLLDFFYTKEEVDAKIGHTAHAYYYSEEEWAELDPVLLEGEFGINSTTGFMKIGDGIHHWSEIDYAIFPVSLSQRGDNLLLKENERDLFLSEASMKKLMLDVIYAYHGETDLVEFVTEDSYSLITADNKMFVQKGQNV